MLKKLISFFFTDRYVKKIIAFGLVYRLILSLLYLSVTIYPMSKNFKDLTWILARFRFEHYIGERTFGYPIFMALCLNNNIAIMVAQFLVGIITWIFWYKTLKNLNFNSFQSFVITLFSGSFVHIFFFENAILYETLILFLTSWIFYLLSDEFFEKENKKTNWLLFVLVGYLTFIKPFFVFVPCLIYGFSVIKNFSFRNIISHRIVIIVSGLSVYFGLSYINKLHTGYFVSSTFFGLNIAQNVVYFAENTSEEYKEFGEKYAFYREKTIREKKDVAMSIWYGSKELKNQTGIAYFPDYSAYLGEYAKTTIAMNKQKYLQQVVTISWVNFWDCELYWEYLSFPTTFSQTFFKTLWRVQYPILIFLKILFLFLTPFYLFRFLKNRKITFELVVVVSILTASILQALVTFGNNARFSYPFEYLMIFIVAMELKTLYNKYFQKKQKIYSKTINNIVRFDEK